SFARLVPIWIATAPISAASAAKGRDVPWRQASAVPTRTGTTEAASVGMRNAWSQAPTRPGWRATTARSPPPSPACTPLTGSGEPAELAEVGLSPLEVRVSSLLRLFGHVVEKRRVPREFLEPRLAVAIGVQRRLEATKRHRAHGEHLPAPRDGLLFEAVER